MVEQYDHMVIGGGVYGTHVAASIAESFPHDKVLLVEQEPKLFMRASTNNQRVLHWGYQSPLHPETARQNIRNVKRFSDRFSDCVNWDVTSYYGIHADSVVSPPDYEAFCENIGLQYERDPHLGHALFGDDVVVVYQTNEVTYSAMILQGHLREQLNSANVEIRINCSVNSLQTNGDNIQVLLMDGRFVDAQNVFNCTFSSINDINARSNLPLIRTTHNRLGLFRITLPSRLKDISATVIYGPFASLIASNGEGTHLLAHVKHSNCAEGIDIAPMDDISADELTRRYHASVLDAKRYLPILGEGQYKGGFTEVRSVSGTDSVEGDRTVQTFRNYGGLENYHVILGGKINCFFEAGEFAVAVLHKRGSNLV